MELVIKPFSNEYLDDIIELFEIVFNKKISREFFIWRYIATPWGSGLFSLAFNKKKLVASYSIMSTELIVDGKKSKIGFSMTTMTHPDYRGKGLFPKLAKNVYQQARSRRYDFIVGFPNDMSYNGFVNKLLWQGLGKMRIFSTNNFDPLLKRFENLKSSLEIEKLDNLNGVDFGSFFNKLNADTRIYFPRDKDYLQWRFFENPSNKYEFYLIHQNTDIGAYAVFKEYITLNQSIHLHLVDFGFRTDEGFIKIFNIVATYLLSGKYTEFSFWTSKLKLQKYFPDFQNWVTIEEMERTYFGFKPLNDKFTKELNEFSKQINWDLKMSDSDTF